MRSPHGPVLARTGPALALAALTGCAATEKLAAPLPPPPMHFEAWHGQLPESGFWKCDPEFGDVDRDGHLDLAATERLGRGAKVWLAADDGTWTPASNGLYQRGSCGGGVSLVDVNRDGLLDLVVADHCNGVFVYLGSGGSRWLLLTDSLFPEALSEGQSDPRRYVGAEDVACGDLDGDGLVDLVTGASDEGGVNVYRGDGTGAGWAWTASGLPSTGWTTRVDLADMNEDGHLDVIASHSRGPRVWLNDGTGTFVDGSIGLPEPMVGGLYTGVAAADLDGDGDLDLVAANWVDGPEAYLQLGDGTWRKTPDVFPEMLGGAIGVDAADLDGDGRTDLVCSGRLTVDQGHVRGVFALFAQPDGTWRFVPNTGLPVTGLSATPGVTITDIDGDGVPDVAACSGLHVETASGNRTQPIIPQRVLVWRGRMPAIVEPIVESGDATPSGSTSARNSSSRAASERPRR